MFKNEYSNQIKHLNMMAFFKSKHIPSRQISNVYYHLVLPYVLSQFVIIIALCNTCRIRNKSIALCNNCRNF